jgi:hypothetical protein
MRPRSCRRTLVAISLLVATAPAWSLSDEEIFRDFPFNFINPGARALGVGGAFISLADDSTAAQANPAGLIHLRRPELFTEIRARSYDTSFAMTGGTLSSPFFQGDITASASSEPSTSVTPAFISFVLPLDRVAIGFSRLESLNTRSDTLNTFSISGTEAIVELDDNTGDIVIIGTQPVDLDLTADADVDAQITQYNIALAFDLHRRFSLGLTGVIGTCRVDGRVDNVFTDIMSVPYPTLDYSTSIDDNDTDFTFNFGMIWEPWDWMQVGTVYRKGLSFVVEEEIGDLGARAAQAQEVFGEAFDLVIPTPDSYGLGLSFRPAEPWTLLFDAVHVEYTDLLDQYVSGLNRISFPERDVAFTVDDGTEYHLGVERILLAGTTPVALRVGAWSDPDHRIRADEQTGLRGAFPGGERVQHYTAGVGVTLKQTIQLDFAADISSANKTFVVSSIFGF